MKKQKSVQRIVGTRSLPGKKKSGITGGNRLEVLASG
jgi:hypothetical protein